MPERHRMQAFVRFLATRPDLGLITGILAGSLIGSITDTLALGISLGIAFGLLLGRLLTRPRRCGPPSSRPGTGTSGFD